MKRSLFVKAASAAAAAAILLTSTLGAAAAEGDGELPESYSSRDMGYTTSVKNQFGSVCWIYATLGTLESKLLHDGYTDVDMSVDHLNYWAITRSNQKGWIRDTSEAAYSVTGIGYVMSWQGGVLNSDFVMPEGGIVYGDQTPASPVRYGAVSARYLKKNDPDSIKRAIYENGGVFASYRNNSAYFNSDRSNYHFPENAASSGVGHAIEVVGWDDNYPKESFKRTPRDNGAWLIKNSWGTGDNIEGYFWMSYYDKYLFSEIFEPAFTFSEVMTLDESVSLNQNEIYGATYEFDENYSAENELTFINVLDADTEHSMIDRVTFESKCIGGSYTIYCLPVSDGVPDGDLEHGTVLAEGVIDYEGYHCADVADFVPEGGKYAIAVRITAPEGKAASVGIGEWLTNNDSSVEEPNYVFVNESENGQSFIIENGAVTDLLDRYREDGDELGATFVIKAVNIREYLRADVNNDGKVDITDATTVQKYAAKLTELDYSQKKAADVDHDGKINISDVTDIQKIIAKLIK